MRLRRAALAGAMVGAVVLGVLSVLGRAVGVGEDDLTVNDFTQNYVSARAWRDGLDPYDETRVLVRRYLGANVASWNAPLSARNPHPPPMILVTAPLSYLSFRTARAAMVCLTSLAMVVAVVLAVRVAGLNAWGAFAVGCGALALPVTQKLLQLVQFEGILALLICSAWRLLRAGRDRTAGWLLGCAAALKLFPAFLLIPLIRRRRFGAAALLLGTGGALLIASLAITGHGALGHYLSASRTNYRFWSAAPYNISVVALPIRWLALGTWRLNPVDLSWFAWALAVTAGISCAVAAARTGAGWSEDPFPAAVPWMILATPLAWEFSLVMMVPFVAAALTRSIVRDRSPNLGVFVLIVLIVVGFPPGSTSGPPGANSVVQVLPFMLPTIALLAWGIGEARSKPVAG